MAGPQTTSQNSRGLPGRPGLPRGDRPTQAQAPGRPPCGHLSHHSECVAGRCSRMSKQASVGWCWVLGRKSPLHLPCMERLIAHLALTHPHEGCRVSGGSRGCPREAAAWGSEKECGGVVGRSRATPAHSASGSRARPQGAMPSAPGEPGRKALPFSGACSIDAFQKGGPWQGRGALGPVGAHVVCIHGNGHWTFCPSGWWC